MPTYEYYCKRCTNDFEITCPMSAHVTRSRCPKCGDDAFQTFTKVATIDDSPVWLNDGVRNQIQGDDGPRIEKRSDYKKYLRSRGIVEVG